MKLCEVTGVQVVRTREKNDCWPEGQESLRRYGGGLWPSECPGRGDRCVEGWRLDLVSVRRGVFAMIEFGRIGKRLLAGIAVLRMVGF
jgi:hypothetical protein